MQSEISNSAKAADYRESVAAL